MSVLADFDTTYTLSAADVVAAHVPGGVKTQQLFDAMAVAGGQTNTTPPLTLAEMAQVYILDDAGVLATINADGLRSHQFMEVNLANAAA